MLEVLDTTSDELALLGDLGIRPSQMFLARVVIWVEGPSDIHYVTALLHEVDKTMVAGRDFAFVSYGGASSSHLDLETDRSENEDEGDAANRLVKVLKVAHRSIIVCDRDRAQGTSDRALIERLIEAASRLPGHARVETSFGREIENGVKESVLLRVLLEVRPKRFNKPNKANITYIDYVIGQDDSFDEVVSLAARDENGRPLSSDLVSRVKERLEQQKTNISDRVRTIGLNEDVFRNEVVDRARQMVRWMRDG
ncbi:hypothetical protein BCY88_04635 [Paraburkholderia fungorum]|uniref:DUF4435 domain-containing protein n=2 Tax=Paraburkholderia fungorum TaxID=134537 RepID=A0A3R7GUA5_9BURK|nr:hypothetical protein BCY88_04635 [Paraburkholderia fungorum]